MQASEIAAEHQIQRSSDDIQSNFSNPNASSRSCVSQPSGTRPTNDALPEQRNTFWKNVIATFGLPCIIGVAAIDPGNLEVDLQAGASTGYVLIWSLLLSSVLGAILQTLAAHTTICTGYHLAELCPRVYARHGILSNTVFFITILSIIAFDIAEVVGTAFAIQMLSGCPLWLGVLLSAGDTMLVLVLQRNGMTRIQFIIEGLLFILAVCLIYEFALASPPMTEIARGTFVPSFGDSPRKGVILAVSIMGSIIMSHNLFLHSWLEKQRRNLIQTDISTATASVSANIFANKSSPNEVLQSCRYAGIESASIFFSTFLINMCVLVIAASLPRASVSEFDDIGLKQAGILLHRALGQRFASTAWAIALLASGHAATVTGTLASQAVCEGFLNIREGSTSSTVILFFRTIAIVPALIAALLAGERGSDGLAVASQTVLSFALPFAAVPLFKVLNTVANMWSSYSQWLLKVGYVVFSFVMFANAYAVWQVGSTLTANRNSVAVFLFSSFVGISSAILVVLILTPIHMSDVATAIDRMIARDLSNDPLITKNESRIMLNNANVSA